MTTQRNYTFGNLEITATRMESKTGIEKHITVQRFNGEYFETLDPMDSDFSKAIKLMLNKENETA